MKFIINYIKTHLRIRDIEKCFGIKLYKWQKDFVIYDKNLKFDRMCGKTVAYLTKTFAYNFSTVKLLCEDKYANSNFPYDIDYRINKRWHDRELLRWYFTLKDFTNNYQAFWWKCGADMKGEN